MKKVCLGLLFMVAAATVAAQQFIGCRTADGWVECPMLCTRFSVMERDKGDRFFVEVASLGYHEVYVNGSRVGDCVMQPAVSQLDKRALQVSYDITRYVKGENEIVICVGQGWGRVYGTPAAVRASVECRTASGRREVLAVSDGRWQASPSGYSYTGSWQPLQFGGERYDARIHERWQPATVYDGGGIAVSHQEFVGNHVVDTLGVRVAEVLPDGGVLLDFGRVVNGWFVARFDAMEAGQEATMEYLDHRDAKPPHTEMDVYVSDGVQQTDVFHNRFHMHAFRYVRVKGAGVTDAQALQISAVNPEGGATFECSDTRLNAIHDMVKYTLGCLTFSGYMVDCPHLERMGYGGDGNSSTNTLQTLWDVRLTYCNWMQAWADAMDSTGDLPYVAPAFRTGGGPYWSGFVVKAPWRTYLNYGDSHLIETYYGQMKRWMDFIEARSEDGILQRWPESDKSHPQPFGRDPNWFLGDWLAPDGVDIGGESALHVSSCFVAECLADMERMAHLMGREDDAQCFATRRKRVVEAVHRHFYHAESHTYANGTPLDQAYALLTGVAPDSATAAAVKVRLIADCHGKYRDHLAVGLVGVSVFTEWCIRERQADLMATLLRQRDYPGYLDMIDKGATATWESWGCGLPDHEDRSRVHNCYNGIGIWFYQALAGLRPDPEHPGYRHFYVDPQPVDGVDWVRATKPTPFGTISIEWGNGKMRLSVPEGSTATLFPGTGRERDVGSGEWTIVW